MDRKSSRRFHSADYSCTSQEMQLQSCCSTTTYQALLVDWIRKLEVGILALLADGIKLLVYASSNPESYLNHNSVFGGTMAIDGLALPVFTIRLVLLFVLWGLVAVAAIESGGQAANRMSRGILVLWDYSIFDTLIVNAGEDCTCHV
ncbi:hypothetical protein F0562_017902 [Nyssa sinensis]|uniref:Uncharacterized protein n=1 Tax=Nyssa sinensis TaxID=561372 RepID=A0A5J4Z7T7_9ASTE|nr:hypothetical protein F0562_017902 [Nyssa sinensis]